VERTAHRFRLALLGYFRFSLLSDIWRSEVYDTFATSFFFGRLFVSIGPCMRIARDECVLFNDPVSFSFQDANVLSYIFFHKRMIFFAAERRSQK
jgi:hypothetical protein